MTRTTWVKIAKHLREQYLEGTKCKLCNETIPEDEKALKTLSNIYRHFKERHPEIIQELKTTE